MASTRLTLTTGEVLPPSRRAYEAVERKGLGHPDTMADLVADVFCYRYARYCLAEFGFVPNHSADKVVLAGADAMVRLGSYRIDEPIRAYYFGKVSRRVGLATIPVEDIFDSAARDVLLTCTRSPAILDHVVTRVRAVVGSPADHLPGYYNPASVDELRHIATTERPCNDTVACAAGSPPTPVERLVVDLERFLQSAEFGESVPDTGADIKVLAVRGERALAVTVCLPFHADAVHSWPEYERRRERGRQVIEAFLAGQGVAGTDGVRLHLNTRDLPGRGYLAPFGTALGKGDVGAVGRGNRYSGVIAPGRAMSVEAPAGKNPIHHVGRIYTVLAQWIADALHTELGLDNEVILTGRIGAELTDPSSISVNTAELPVDAEQVWAIVRAKVADAGNVTASVLQDDPIERVRAAYGYDTALAPR